jgi:hypothetical protein
MRDRNYPNKLFQLYVENEERKPLDDISPQPCDFIDYSQIWVLLNFAKSLFHLS